MGIERARVVEVHAGDSVMGAAGAGYQVDDRHVLTSAAVVGRSRATAVRPSGTAGWVEAPTVWRDGAGDAALLELSDPAVLLPSPAPLRWGTVVGRGAVTVVAMGFPPSSGRPEWPRDPLQVVARMDPAGGVCPAAGAPAPLPAGMPGAALFAGAEVVGVLVEGRRAVPVSALAADPRFVELVGDERGLALVPVTPPLLGLPILHGR